jgi:PiT family inorganic phosphate transporter
MAVLVGATAWVALATLTRLPVSTTHAIVGALVGAGIQLAPGAVNWGALLSNVAGPLLASIGVAYLISAFFNCVPFGRTECVRVQVAQPSALVAHAAETLTVVSESALPILTVETGTMAECRARGAGGLPSPSRSRTG